MILILIAFVVVLVVCCFLIVNDDCGLVGGVIAPFIACFSLFSLLVYGFICFDYLAAEHKANIINREYNTNYTQIEVFYASDVIDTVRELDRKRIELNGDLVTGK